jgi:phosphomannomutase / phosphoglucomutase
MSKRSFWGRYDIRAVVSEDFGPSHYRNVGKAYAKYVQHKLGAAQESYWVSVGHDARLHSVELSQALIEGLTQAGLNVVRLGLSTSPIVYFSEHLHELNAEFPSVVGTITVTASHNPAEYNGMKFTFKKGTLNEQEFLHLQELYNEIASGTPVSAATVGQVDNRNILSDYQGWFAQQFGQIGKGIKVVIDSGNATAGIAAPQVFRLLGCDVVDIFTEPDGRFPNHHPDPCVHKNLVFLMDEVLKSGADFGIAFDGDADRLGLVDNKGRIVPGDQITLFLAEKVLKKQPGAEILFDIKGTQTLLDYIKNLNGVPTFAPSGHAFMKKLMKEHDIPLGGELSGHIFFRDEHWGFDDALYAGCRVLEAYAFRRQENAGFAMSDFVEALPQTIISEEIRVKCTREEGIRLMDELHKLLERKPDFFGSPVTEILTLDGFRANIENGFFLVRSSNTEPCITIRFEAPSETQYQFIEKRIPELCESFLSPVCG